MKSSRGIPSSVKVGYMCKDNIMIKDVLIAD